MNVYEFVMRWWCFIYEIETEEKKKMEIKKISNERIENVERVNNHAKEK